MVFCGVEPNDWKWGKDLDDIYRLEHLKDIFHDGHPNKATGYSCRLFMINMMIQTHSPGRKQRVISVDALYKLIISSLLLMAFSS